MFFSNVAIALFVSIRTRPDFATSSDSKISGFARQHGSKLFADSKISTLEIGFKKLRIRMRIHRIRVDERRIRKEKVADSKISGYVWTGPYSKNLRLQNGLLTLTVKAGVNFSIC